MFWIRRAKDEDQDAILSLVEQANLPGKGAYEEAAIFFVVEAMVKEEPQIMGTAGLSLCGAYGLFRSFVLKEEAQSQEVILELMQVLLCAASDEKLEKVYLITSQPGDWLQAFYFYPVAGEDIPDEIFLSSHFRATMDRGEIFSCALSSPSSESYNGENES